MGRTGIFESAHVFVVALVLATARAESCFDTSAETAGQGVFNGQRTECFEISNQVPSYVIYPENGRASNAAPLALAFVSGELPGFRLTRDRDLEDSCPTYFNLDSGNIGAWASSSNPEDVTNNLDNICFVKYFFVEESGTTFAYKLAYKVSAQGSEGNKLYEPRKVAVSTPSGGEFVFLDQKSDLSRVCTTCLKREGGSPSASSVLSQSSNLVDVLNGLK